MVDDAVLLNFPDFCFPKQYLVLDIETTGFSKQVDFIMQIGLLHIANEEVKNKTSFYMQVPEGSLSDGAFKAHGITEEKCNKEGLPRHTACLNLASTLANWFSMGGVIVGHNAARFDLPFISSVMTRENVDFDFHDQALVDTGCLVKAIQINTFPLTKETPSAYWHRISSIRAHKVYWALERYCIPEFKLEERMKEEKLSSHDALADCIVTSWVLEALKKRRAAIQALMGKREVG